MADGYQPKTAKGYDLFEVSSALQKSIRRGEEDTAMYFAVELFNSNFGEYLWKRLRIIVSEDVGLAEPNMPANIQALYQTYQELVKKSDGTHTPQRLPLTHAVLMLCRAKKSRLNDWALIAYWGEHDNEDMPIPDYAFDKHNLKGRKMGRGIEHFFKEGSRLENHAVQPGEEEIKKRAFAVSDKGKKKSDRDAIQDSFA